MEIDKKGEKTMALTKCSECGKEISDKASSCPNCGAPASNQNDFGAPASDTSTSKPVKQKKKGSCLKTILIVIGVFVALGFLGSLFGGDSEAPEKQPASETVASKDENIITDNEIAEEPEDESVPKEYRSALNKAKSYSDMMHMSKQGIYDQLTSEYGEQFTTEAAQYAVDNVDADWNYNALKKAENYSDTMYMSKQAIFDQLVSEYGEKFTEDEAQYAIDNIQADWNRNALEKAKTYQDSMDMSPAAIHDQLTSSYGEKFTNEEADFAIENLDK